MRSAVILLLACLVPAALAGQSPDDRAWPHPRSGENRWPPIRRTRLAPYGEND